MRNSRNFQRVGAVIGSLAALGSLIGLIIAINKWQEEKPNLKIEVSEVDLVKYVSEPEIESVRPQEIYNELIQIEASYQSITERHVLNVIEDFYDFFTNTDRVGIEYPETNSDEPDLKEVLENTLETSIEDLKSLQRNASSAPSPNDSNSDNSEGNNGSLTDEQRYSAVITKLERIQKIVNGIETKKKVIIEVRVENGSRLSNYVDSQGILMFYRDETSFSTIPQIVVSIEDDEDNLDSGKIDGYGVNSITLRAEFDDLEKDYQNYTDFAFKARADGDETYNLIFAIEDIKGKMWYEEALFSTFTEKTVKDGLKIKAEGIFRNVIQ